MQNIDNERENTVLVTIFSYPFPFIVCRTIW
ncbi:hypothetical protein PIOMA14_I_0465 [Prevotella intermedia]|uniref:Uncharacterized protein n=1 Tax=Prevotella intermedia TaxID=28131 RepID=A0A0S3UHI6_PREIN|nr:hypothetical protein PIOMA14_I_0465 [Prevotella intermedia]